MSRAHSSLIAGPAPSLRFSYSLSPHWPGREEPNDDHQRLAEAGEGTPPTPQPLAEAGAGAGRECAAPRLSRDSLTNSRILNPRVTLELPLGAPLKPTDCRVLLVRGRALVRQGSAYSACECHLGSHEVPSREGISHIPAAMCRSAL